MRSAAGVAVASLALVACGPAPVAPPPPPQAPGPDAGGRAFDAGRWGEFKSARFELRLPMPDGHGWRIDDHATSWLSATHAATASALLVRRWREDEIVNRQKCERRARVLRPLPDREGSELLEERAIAIPPDFDTHVEVRIVPARSAQPLRGFAIAFGGWAHACFAFVYTTSADGPTAEALVGDRLATMVEKSLGALVVESPLRLGEQLRRVEPAVPAP